MAQAKLGPRLSILLLCINICFLTSLGLAAFYYRLLPSSLLSVLVYIIFWALLFASAVDFFDSRSYGKLSGRKFLVLAFAVVLISALLTHSVWAIVTPRWSFIVSTDKAIYRPGEAVAITVYLKNNGLISHSFKSALRNPVFVSVEYQYSPSIPFLHQVYYSPLNRTITAFAVEPGETLERSFLWNQTDIYDPEQEIEQGIYWIHALVPGESASTTFGSGNIFSDWTSINITST
jgi:hypothetical protein